MLTANEAWYKRLKSLLDAPKVLIRNMWVHEEVGQTVVVNMNDSFVINNDRCLSNKFRFGEAYWILSGDNKVTGIEEYAPSIRHFSDNGYVFQGAYGPKITEQLHYVCETLSKDLHSRQAVISIWRENPRQSKDIPCTISLQFLIRDEEINCIATMRSSDVWLGLPYDIFNFTCVANWIRLWLNTEFDSDFDKPCLKLGKLIINIGSSHLYERNYATACGVTLDPPDMGIPGDINEAQTPDAFMNWLKWNRDNA